MTTDMLPGFEPKPPPPPDQLGPQLFRINLPWTLPPLTANQRMHWRAKARVTKDVRQVASLLGRKAPRTEMLVVTLHYRPRDRRRRDRHNLWPTVKALVDGLVDAGIVPDDDAEHLSTPEPVIHQPNGTKAALWLELDYPQRKSGESP
jgi:crossover junction endodeoxyribonuclease RusA